MLYCKGLFNQHSIYQFLLCGTEKNVIYRILITIPPPHPLNEFTSSRKFYSGYNKKTNNQMQTNKKKEENTLTKQPFQNCRV